MGPGDSVFVLFHSYRKTVGKRLATDPHPSSSQPVATKGSMEEPAVAGGGAKPQPEVPPLDAEARLRAAALEAGLPADTVAAVKAKLKGEVPEGNRFLNRVEMTCFRSPQYFE